MPAMPEILKAEVVIVGAGVLGLCTAVELTLRGHEVRVVDAGGTNASSVAAGMIAPALEAVLDRVTPERATLFRDARAAWNGFAASAGIRIHSAPTFWAGGDTPAMIQALDDLGFVSPEIGADSRVSLPSDVLIEPGPALQAMAAILAVPVLQARVAAIARMDTGWRIETGAGAVEARTLVLATGTAGIIAGMPDTVARLIGQVEPIRGQIGFAAQEAINAVIRATGIYVAPSGRGMVVGATMEPGRRDLESDAAVGDRLVAAAERMLARSLAGPVDWRVGIRGASPDGLPMAGDSGEAGLFLALAPRRNGWLLGPLVAGVVADVIEGGSARSPHSAALDPRRFAIR